jgi:hypothetical protein
MTLPIQFFGGHTANNETFNRLSVTELTSGALGFSGQKSFTGIMRFMKSNVVNNSENHSGSVCSCWPMVGSAAV